MKLFGGLQWKYTLKHPLEVEPWDVQKVAGCEVTWRSAMEVHVNTALGSGALGCVESGSGRRETVLGWRRSCEVTWWCAIWRSNPVALASLRGPMTSATARSCSICRVVPKGTVTAEALARVAGLGLAEMEFLSLVCILAWISSCKVSLGIVRRGQFMGGGLGFWKTLWHVLIGGSDLTLFLPLLYCSMILVGLLVGLGYLLTLLLLLPSLGRLGCLISLGLLRVFC